LGITLGTDCTRFSAGLDAGVGGGEKVVHFGG
jgi:hypothetical protein